MFWEGRGWEDREPEGGQYCRGTAVLRRPFNDVERSALEKRVWSLKCAVAPPQEEHRDSLLAAIVGMLGAFPAMQRYDELTGLALAAAYLWSARERPPWAILKACHMVRSGTAGLNRAFCPSEPEFNAVAERCASAWVDALRRAKELLRGVDRETRAKQLLAGKDLRPAHRLTSPNRQVATASTPHALSPTSKHARHGSPIRPWAEGCGAAGRRPVLRARRLWLARDRLRAPRRGRARALPSLLATRHCGATAQPYRKATRVASRFPWRLALVASMRPSMGYSQGRGFTIREGRLMVTRADRARRKLRGGSIDIEWEEKTRVTAQVGQAFFHGRPEIFLDSGISFRFKDS